MTNVGSLSTVLLRATADLATDHVGIAPRADGYDSDNEYLYATDDGSTSVSVLAPV